MDTTLMTFMVKTSLSTNSVHLIGSWDKFSKHYSLMRDSSQSQSHWRGCHQFENIICDGDQVNRKKRKGGLKMGLQYFYYYELDGNEEYYDPTMPFTTKCPYLPGQPVNILWVPIEVPARRDHRASMSSARGWDIKTTNPADKYVSARDLPCNFVRPLHTSCSATYSKGIDLRSSLLLLSLSSTSSSSSSSSLSRTRRNPSLYSTRTTLKNLASAISSTSQAASIKRKKPREALETCAPIVFKCPPSPLPKSREDFPVKSGSSASQGQICTNNTKKKRRKPLPEHLMPLCPLVEKKTNSLHKLTLSTNRCLKCKTLDFSLQNKSSENCFITTQESPRSNPDSFCSSITLPDASFASSPTSGEWLHFLDGMGNENPMIDHDSESLDVSEFLSQGNLSHCKFPTNHSIDSTIPKCYSNFKSIGLKNQIAAYTPSETHDLCYDNSENVIDLENLRHEMGYLSDLIII